MSTRFISEVIPSVTPPNRAIALVTTSPHYS